MEPNKNHQFKYNKTTLVDESDSKFKLLFHGEEVIIAEYEPLTERWHITSKKFAIDEHWQYGKEQKKEVMDRIINAMECVERDVKPVKLIYHIGQTLAITLVLIDLIMLITGINITPLTVTLNSLCLLIMLCMACHSLITAIKDKNPTYVVAFILWVVCAAQRMNHIFR